MKKASLISSIRESLFKRKMAQADKMKEQGLVQQALCQYEELAEGNYAPAQYALGIAYKNGDEVPADLEKAVYWLEKAVENDSDDARTTLGRMYFHGTGVKKDLRKSIELTGIAAEHGNCFAQYNLAYCYLHGEGVGEDKSKAFYWYKKSADQGYNAAQYMVGQCWANGWGTVFNNKKRGNIRASNDDIRALFKYARLAEAHKKGAEMDGKVPSETEVKYAFAKFINPELVAEIIMTGFKQISSNEESVKWYTRAANQKYDKACYELGRLWFERSSEKREEAKPKWFDFLVQAAERGHKDSQALLGDCYFRIKRTPKEAMRWYRAAAEQECITAQIMLGDLCTAKKPSEAIKWYYKAAEQGNAVAQYKFGNCYRNGIGIKKDIAEAVKWYHKAAEQGHARAQTDLGYCYRYGIAVDADAEKAVELYRAAAEKGLAEAQNNLGYCYQNSIGVERNTEEAVKWYHKAAEQGFAIAQYNLGNCYLYSCGVEKDIEKAVRSYRAAAGKGQVDACIALARLYMNGVEITQDLDEAQNWCERIQPPTETSQKLLLEIQKWQSEEIRKREQQKRANIQLWLDNYTDGDELPNSSECEIMLAGCTRDDIDRMVKQEQAEGNFHYALLLTQIAEHQGIKGGFETEIRRADNNLQVAGLLCKQIVQPWLENEVLKPIFDSNVNRAWRYVYYEDLISDNARERVLFDHQKWYKHINEDFEEVQKRFKRLPNKGRVTPKELSINPKPLNIRALDLAGMIKLLEFRMLSKAEDATIIREWCVIARDLRNKAAHQDSETEEEYTDEKCEKALAKLLEITKLVTESNTRELAEFLDLSKVFCELVGPLEEFYSAFCKARTVKSSFGK